MSNKTSESKLAYLRDYWAKNPEYRKRRTLYRKTWSRNNPDKIKAQRVKYYAKRKDYIIQKSHDYYHNVRKQYLSEHADEERVKNREKSQVKYAKRKALLLQLRKDMGGKCTKCSYSEEIRILTFHHLGDKIDNVTNLQSLEAMRTEAKKCILLCPNCHALTHLN